MLTMLLGFLLLVVLFLASTTDDGPGSPRPAPIPVRASYRRRR